MSITDIQSLLKPITDKYFHNGKDFNLERIYNEVFSLEKETVERMKEDIKVKFARSMETFEDAPEESVEFLRKFAFICELSYDVYVKKQIIEKMIDELNASAKKVPADNRKEKK